MSALSFSFMLLVHYIVQLPPLTDMPVWVGQNTNEPLKKVETCEIRKKRLFLLRAQIT